MSTEAPPSGGSIKGWIKGVVGSVFGLLGGAVIAYLTPLVENVARPGKPVANFAYQAQSTTVSFNNRSTGATQGWWDFGDGSALEPFDAAKDIVNHTYPKAGSYNVKLTLANLLGDQGERSVSINIDPTAAPTPTITSLTVDPFSPGSAAPALFRVKATVKDATQCIWVLDDGRDLEFTDAGSTQEKLFSFNDPGTYTVRLVAVNGTQRVQVVKSISVGYYADSNAPQATLNVVYQGQQVEQLTRPFPVSVAWTAGPNDAACSFAVTRLLDQAFKNYQIVAGDVTNKADPRVRNVTLEVTPDRKQFIVKGQLVRQGGWGLNKPAANASWLAEVKLSLEYRTPVKTITPDPITVAIKEVGTTAIPIPPPPSNCPSPQKQLTLALTDGAKTIYNGPTPTTGAQVMLKNRPMRLTAREANGQLVLEVAELRSPLRPSGN